MITTGDGTATIVDSDYVAQTNAPLSVLGHETKTFDVTINSDVNPEDDEDFTVTLSGDVGTVTTSTVTINDDDGKKGIESFSAQMTN